MESDMIGPFKIHHPLQTYFLRAMLAYKYGVGLFYLFLTKENKGKEKHPS